MSARVVKESTWARIMEMESGSLLQESRFLNSQFIVPADQIISMWPTMTNDEQLEFLTAFLARPNLQDEDNKILNFLMRVDDDKVWVMIAPLMAKYPDRDLALKFLLDRIKTDSKGLANCFYALELMHDVRAVAFIRRKFEDYRDRYQSTGAGMGTIALIDFAYACSALRKLERSNEYETILRSLKNVGDIRVQNQAKRILNE